MVQVVEYTERKFTLKLNFRCFFFFFAIISNTAAIVFQLGTSGSLVVRKGTLKKGGV